MTFTQMGTGQWLYMIQSPEIYLDGGFSDGSYCGRISASAAWKLFKRDKKEWAEIGKMEWPAKPTWSGPGSTKD